MTTIAKPIHTPGPWKSIPATLEDMLVRGSNGVGVAEVWNNGREPDQDLANKRLISAAPELLAALIAVANEIDGPDRPYSSDSWLPSSVMEQIRAAVSKATRDEP